MKRKTGAERRKFPRKPVKVSAQFQVAAALPPRRAPRVQGQLEQDGTWHDCLIVNISPGGAKVSTDKRFGQAKNVRLRIGKFGSFGGEIVWRSDSELGLRFTHDPQEMNEVIVGLALYG
ncbi:MAG: PilZ domain-containing protein [Elusimicrobia bacterium]|nr:PilZ domain-containing protein [Elusimicrobiota bacterium]